MKLTRNDFAQVRHGVARLAAKHLVEQMEIRNTGTGRAVPLDPRQLYLVVLFQVLPLGP